MDSISVPKKTNKQTVNSANELHTERHDDEIRLRLVGCRTRGCASISPSDNNKGDENKDHNGEDARQCGDKDAAACH